MWFNYLITIIINNIDESCKRELFSMILVIEWWTQSTRIIGIFENVHIRVRRDWKACNYLDIKIDGSAEINTSALWKEQQQDEEEDWTEKKMKQAMILHEFLSLVITHPHSL